jgi:hypothetical protein
MDTSFVMPGLVPGIHGSFSKGDVDGRVKPGQDDEKVLLRNSITKRYASAYQS